MGIKTIILLWGTLHRDCRGRGATRAVTLPCFWLEWFFLQITWIIYGFYHLNSRTVTLTCKFKLNVKFNKVNRHELSAAVDQVQAHMERCSSTFMFQCSFGAGISAVLSSLEQLFSSIPLPSLHSLFFSYSPFHWSNQCWRVPGMGAHGWVAGICQSWGCILSGWTQWKPLDTPGTHLPFKQGGG